MTYNVHILLKNKSNRAIYIFRTIFLEILGFDKIDFFTERDAFIQKEGVKISYDIFLQGIPFITSASEILYENTINKIKPEDFTIESDLPCFFLHKDDRSILPFDFPSMGFWLLSRYEEYQFFQPDRHGRFTAQQSFAYQHGFLELPLIDLWAIRLKEKLFKFYQTTEFPPSKTYTFQPSFDIDYAWAYRNRPFWRKLAAGLKDILKLDFVRFSDRLAVLLGKKKDPYYNFSTIEELHRDRQKPIFFWLIGNYGEFDKNTHYNNAEFRQLIFRTSAEHEAGIHPSYASNYSKGTADIELKRLESICRKKITKSRQHFLKIKFPETYQKLLEMGISDDYSLGYAEFPGFRASISGSFFWYDLSSEKETTLRIHPFMIMDVTLNLYCKLQPDEAIEVSKKIIDNCKSVGGTLITVWHNNSLSEKDNWKGWTALYQNILDMAYK